MHAFFSIISRLAFIRPALNEYVNQIKSTEIGGLGMALCTVLSSYSIPHLNANDATVLIAVFTTVIQLYKLYLEAGERKRKRNENEPGR